VELFLCSNVKEVFTVSSETKVQRKPSPSLATGETSITISGEAKIVPSMGGCCLVKRELSDNISFTNIPKFKGF